MISGKEVYNKATDAVNKKGLPVPKQPSGKDVEFEFPDDPNQIRSIEIGQWMLKFTGFFNYTTRLLGLVDSELVGLDAEYKLAVNNHAQEAREKIGGRVNTDVVESMVLKEHDYLEPLYSRRIELNAIKVQLEARAKIYEKGYAAMSRELARREMESKL